jgi:hypothetical protein
MQGARPIHRTSPRAATGIQVASQHVSTKHWVKATIKRRIHARTAPPPLIGSSLPALESARAVTGDRLLVKPVFILSSIRSGSTLLRLMLNAHSKLHAPHELHLAAVRVNLASKYATFAMEEIGLDAGSLQFLLWDRLLHREMLRDGKSVLVNKTPSDAFIWQRIVECWPDARFIFLLRHPAAITDSWQRARKKWTRDEVAEDVRRYMLAVEEAREEHGGLSVRYEDITTDPEREMRRICDFIGVEWEPAMLNYKQATSGKLRAGLGDWSARIKSGKIQAVERMPARDEIPGSLVKISRQWGYLAEGE